MKAKNGIGWILCECISLTLLVADLWTGKLPLNQLAKILLASAIGAMLFVGIMRRYAQKERERTRAPKKTE